jgi:hypothetical protein
MFESRSPSENVDRNQDLLSNLRARCARIQFFVQTNLARSSRCHKTLGMTEQRKVPENNQNAHAMQRQQRNGKTPFQKETEMRHSTDQLLGLLRIATEQLGTL